VRGSKSKITTAALPIDGKRSAGQVKSTKSLGFGFGGWSDEEDQVP
jgi:hypothetical protein